jgi:hypothetical protein
VKRYSDRLSAVIAMPEMIASACPVFNAPSSSPQGRPESGIAAAHPVPRRCAGEIDVKPGKMACLIEKAEGRKIHGGDETDAGERLKIRRGDAFRGSMKLGTKTPSAAEAAIAAQEKQPKCTHYAGNSLIF